MAPKITAPVADFDGKVVGVSFTKGVANTDDEGALAYFRRQGYGIGDGEATPTGEATATAAGDALDADLDSLSSKDLKTRAKDRGVSGSGKKDDIIKRIREKNAEVAAELEEHEARDAADKDGDGEQDANPVPTPAGGEQHGEANPAATETGVKPAEVAGSSEHGSVREVEE